MRRLVYKRMDLANILLSFGKKILTCWRLGSYSHDLPESPASMAQTQGRSLSLRCLMPICDEEHGVELKWNQNYIFVKDQSVDCPTVDITKINVVRDIPRFVIKSVFFDHLLPDWNFCDCE